MRRSIALLLASVLCCASAVAQVATTTVAVVSTSWSDLGSGPVLLSVMKGPIRYVIAASGTTVPLQTMGYTMNPGDVPIAIQTTQHIFALSLQTSGATAIVSPITSSGGGGGSPSLNFSVASNSMYIR